MTFKHIAAGISCLAWLAILGVPGGLIGEVVFKSDETLAIQSVLVDGKLKPVRSAQVLRLPPSAQNITFNFGATGETNQEPIRYRYKMEGADLKWREGVGSINEDVGHGDVGQMCVKLIFCNTNGDQVNSKIFWLTGESPGWTGVIDTSPFVHRHETVTVPPGAAGFWFMLSSSGPPPTIGIYILDDLDITRVPAAGGIPQLLLRAPTFDQKSIDQENPLPIGWKRDGTRPSMARIVSFKDKTRPRALAIWDQDPGGHADWHNIKASSLPVTPGDRLVLEWDEMFSIGIANMRQAVYTNLPPGDYRFRVMEVTSIGLPTGVAASLPIIVPPPFWKLPWFWGLVVAALIIALIAGEWYLGNRRLRLEALHHERQRMLELERMRIAQDIHDDLGARVTQISLFSGIASEKQGLSGDARADFDQISQMTRDLVFALYETVWSINPKNDSLMELGNYLCQMTGKFGEQTKLQCRFYVSGLNDDTPFTSSVRHNIIMVVKEAVNNVIKHAHASELILRIDYVQNLLSISVQDDGCGFQIANQPAGDGLHNMQKRSNAIGGRCTIESQPRRGTTVRLEFAVKSTDE